MCQNNLIPWKLNLNAWGTQIIRQFLIHLEQLTRNSDYWLLGWNNRFKSKISVKTAQSLEELHSKNVRVRNCQHLKMPEIRSDKVQIQI